MTDWCGEFIDSSCGTEVFIAIESQAHGHVSIKYQFHTHFRPSYGMYTHIKLNMRTTVPLGCKERMCMRRIPKDMA